MKPSLLFTTMLLGSLTLASCGSKDSSVPVLTPESGTEAVKTGSASEQVPKKDTVVIVSHDVKLTLSRVVEMEDDFSNIEDVRENLNIFKVKAEVSNAFAQEAEFSCFKIIGGDEVVKSTIPAGTKAKTIEVKINDNEVEAYINCRVAYEGRDINTEGNFKLTKSVLLDSETKLSDIPMIKGENGYNLDRLILLRNGKLITDGDSFTLNVKKLYSQDSIIQTFSDKKIPGQKLNMKGLSGGSVELKSEYSTGVLTVNMFGQNGDDQTYVPPKKPGRGAKGSPAEPKVQTNNCPEPKLIIRPFGSSLVMPPIVPMQTGFNCNPRYSEGKPAGDGSQGAIGESGADAWDGGASGSLSLFSNDESHFVVHFDVRGGSAGAPGKGGEGQEGGEGGNAADGFGRGADGPKGPQGPSGAPGKNGAIQKSCSANLKTHVTTCN